MKRAANDAERSIARVPARIRPALCMLWEALEYARQTNGDPWEFAVEVDQLSSLGLHRNDLRWLVRGGLVVHRREVTIEGDDGRAFRNAGNLTFSDRSCFVLAAAGAALAQTIVNGPGSTAAAGFAPESAEESRQLNGADAVPQLRRPLRPRWDSLRRELLVGGTIVKRFRWPAVNQERILATFEEEGWPAHIDDPLPPRPDQDSKQRLSDTIKCLNRKQTCRLLHFRGDGTGQGVVWEFSPRLAGPASPRRNI